MNTREIKKFGILNSVTILNDKRIAYCTKLIPGQFSKAIIYDTHQNENFF